MKHQFKIICENCGAKGFYDLDNKGPIKVYFGKETPTIMSRIIIYCSNCGGKEEAGICWPLNTNTNPKVIE